MLSSFLLNNGCVGKISENKCQYRASDVCENHILNNFLLLGDKRQQQTADAQERRERRSHRKLSSFFCSIFLSRGLREESRMRAFRHPAPRGDGGDGAESFELN